MSRYFMMPLQYDFGMKNTIISAMFMLYAIAMIVTGAMYIRIKNKNPGYPRKMYFVGAICILLAVTNILLAFAIFIKRAIN